jgi:hypothetical protein
MHLRKQLQQLEYTQEGEQGERALCLALLARKTKSLQVREWLNVVGGVVVSCFMFLLTF